MHIAALCSLKRNCWAEIIHIGIAPIFYDKCRLALPKKQEHYGLHELSCLVVGFEDGRENRHEREYASPVC